MNKKLIGAILSALAFIIYYGVLFFIFVYASIQDGNVPIPIFIIFIVFLLIPMVGVSAAFILRIQELKNGEEEEASKY